MTSYPTDLAQRLLARPRLVAYMDLDLDADEIEPGWCLVHLRRVEPLPREFIVREGKWGAYDAGFEKACERDQAWRMEELNQRPPDWGGTP